MAEISSIKVARARKINLGNYETTDVFVEVSGSVGLTEDPDEVFVSLVNKADKFLDAEVVSILKERKSNR